MTSHGRRGINVYETLRVSLERAETGEACGCPHGTPGLLAATHHVRTRGLGRVTFVSPSLRFLTREMGMIITRLEVVWSVKEITRDKRSAQRLYLEKHSTGVSRADHRTEPLGWSQRTWILALTCRVTLAFTCQEQVPHQ